MPDASSNCSTSGSTWLRETASDASWSTAISTSKWPAFASIAPSFMRSKCSRARTSRPPVTVMKTSPRSAASSAGMTSQPSIRASSARIGSISQTITDAPAPRARSATPLPVQP